MRLNFVRLWLKLRLWLMLRLMLRHVEVVRENLEAQPVRENRVADFLPILAILCPGTHAHLNIQEVVNHLFRP